MKSLWAFGAGATTKPEPGLAGREQWRVMTRVLPLLWPKGELELKARTMAAAGLVIFAKLVKWSFFILHRNCNKLL